MQRCSDIIVMSDIKQAADRSSDNVAHNIVGSFSKHSTVTSDSSVILRDTPLLILLS